MEMSWWRMGKEIDAITNECSWPSVSAQAACESPQASTSSAGASGVEHSTRATPHVEMVVNQ